MRSRTVSAPRLVVLSLATAGAMAAQLIAVPPAAAATPRCDGKVATIVGTDGWDHLTGTPGDDVIVGLGGRDIIDGGAGNDTICGNEGRNTLIGGPGNDTLIAGTGRAEFYPGSGNDRMVGGPLRDFVHYEDAPRAVDVDLATGQASGWGHDPLTGTEGVYGSRFDDTLRTASFELNWAFGGRGDDVLIGTSATDILAGGAGADRILGNGGSDTLIGNAGADLLIGGTGNDSLEGDSGNDVLRGGAGRDQLLGGLGADSLNGGPGRDVCDEAGIACELP